MNKLYSFELYLYFFIWTSATLYSLFSLYVAQEEILRNGQLLDTLHDLEQGWKFIERLRDVSDVEWSSWKYFIQTSWFHLIFTFVISEFLRTFSNVKYLKCWYIISTLIFTAKYMGYKHVSIILAQPVVYVTILYFGGKKLSIWIISILLLTSYNSIKYNNFFWSFLDHENIQDEEIYLILFSIPWIELRCISFSIDYLEDENTHKLKLNEVLNMFSYVLYLPLFYTGPVIIYEEFKKSFNVKQEKVTSRAKTFVMDMTIFLLYAFILDLLFHYIYFFAMQNNMQLIRKLPTFALCGGGFWMGVEFHIKYVILYGTAAAFSRMDNIEPPPTPRCIARIHVYSQMWRHFDVGLYRFLVKYIYKPIYSIIGEYINCVPTIAKKLIASFATFFFVFIWHGTIWHVFVWSVFNYIGITLEHCGKLISKHRYYEYYKRKFLKTEAMESRFIATLCAPLLALSAISNFYLFAGSEVGNVFFECFSGPTLINVVTLFISLYSCCVVSMALEDYPSRGVRKETKRGCL